MFQHKKGYALILLMMLFMMASSAIAAISSVVTDRNSKPLEGVTVTTNLKHTTTMTDSDGKFNIDDDDQIKKIRFSSVGYRLIEYAIDNLPEVVVMEAIAYKSSDIIVTADRAVLGITPVAFDNLSADEIERDYTVGEFPLLLSTTPNLHSFSDGGAPLGYSYTRLRGFDDKRIVTYINGVPLNDPEDHATYFVDLVDFGANVTDIQIQRGVGNSLYGDGSFGGTINIVTSAFDQSRKIEMVTGYGSYLDNGDRISDIAKSSVEYSTGIIDNKYAFSGRFSKQRSGGYRHNSWYDGWSYYFSMGRIDPNMTTEMYVYGGPIRMHLSYWGSPSDEIANNRRHNPLGYSNETDNFNQPHYHLHNRYRINDKTTLTNTIFYIRGKGYYEQFKGGRTFSDYNITSNQLELDPSTGQPYIYGDLVRQQWVKKNQYGWNPRLDIEHDRGQHSLGGSFYIFDSDHWGEVVWASHLLGNSPPRLKYYQYYGDKTVGSIFFQEYYKLSDKLNVQATLQLRYQKYKLNSQAMGAFVGYDYDVDWLFLSPRLGATYKIDDRLSLFGNFSIASRTPSDVAIYDANDPDIVPSLDAEGNPTAKTERVYDFELGGNYASPEFNFGMTVFYMFFNDEIIPYGGINESGVAFTTNAKRSLHAGLELTSAYRASERFRISSNLAFNHNRIKEIDANDSFMNNFADKTIPYFPEYVGNLILDYQSKRLRLTYTHQFNGQQYMELYNIADLAVESYQTASLAANLGLGEFLSLGKLNLQVRIDNLFDEEYNVSGYGGNYMGAVDIEGWAEYYVGPSRSIYTQAKIVF